MALESLNKITLDVSTPLNIPVVRAVQEDIRSRYVEITLVSNGEPLVLPAGVTAIVGLRRANDTYVLYDTDEDNNPAVTFNGNKATVYLRQEAVAMAGSMYTTVTLFDGTNKHLSAFAFTLKVDQTAVPSSIIVESDYINIFQHELDEINTLLNNLSATATTLPAGSDATASYSDGVFSFGIPQGVTDTELSDSSTNAVQNKVITNALTHVLTIEEDTETYPVPSWTNGYIKSSDGTVGSDPQRLVSGMILGDGNTWNFASASGWVIEKVAKYSGLSRGTFDEMVKPFGTYTSFDIPLVSGKYYSMGIRKEPIANISPSDAGSNTVVISRQETDYIPVWSESVHSFNWCNPNAIVANSGKGMQPDGTTRTSSDLSYTDFIPVTPGDKVYILQNSQPSTYGRYRYVTAYTENKVAVESKGDDTTRRVYTVPEGIAYVIVTVYLSDYNLGKYSINVGKMYPFDEYSVVDLPEGVGNNKKGIDLLQKMPLTSMPEYMVKCLSYRPLSAPTKGYFCFVTDDGHADMVTYTIPMVIDKQIPCTFAVMKESACFATPEQTAVVVDAVTNHGCAISQHGGRNWTEFSEYGLNQFFDDEKVFWDSLGVTVKSAVIPSHYTTPLISAVAGGRFGVVRSGGQGYDPEGHYGGTVRNYYDYFTSGEGSNLFALSSYNVTTHTLEENKLAVDYAYANNKIMIVYIHENSLTDAKKEVLEGVIDYAKTKGLTFITLNKIPYLNEGTITM